MLRGRITRAVPPMWSDEDPVPDLPAAATQVPAPLAALISCARREQGKCGKDCASCEGQCLVIISTEAERVQF